VDYRFVNKKKPPNYVYVIEGKEFDDKAQAVVHVKKNLECTVMDAIKYVDSLPVITK
jgi:hypothetical protein